MPMSAEKMWFQKNENEVPAPESCFRLYNINHTTISVGGDSESQLLPCQPLSHAPVQSPPPDGPEIGFPCLHVGPCRIAVNLAAPAHSTGIVSGTTSMVYSL